MREKTNNEKLKKMEDLENNKIMNGSFADLKRMWESSFVISSKLTKDIMLKHILKQYIGKENTEHFLTDPSTLKNLWIDIVSESSKKVTEYYVSKADDKMLEIKCINAGMVQMFRFKKARSQMFQNPFYSNNIKISLILIKDYPFDNRRDIKALTPIKEQQKNRKKTLTELMRRLEKEVSNAK